jgi:hypothetical protein
LLRRMAQRNLLLCSCAEKTRRYDGSVRHSERVTGVKSPLHQ